jgi:hypothetical protein
VPRALTSLLWPSLLSLAAKSKLEKRVKVMNYRKPQIELLGTAAECVQGQKDAGMVEGEVSFFSALRTKRTICAQSTGTCSMVETSRA